VKKMPAHSSNIAKLRSYPRDVKGTRMLQREGIARNCSRSAIVPNDRANILWMTVLARSREDMESRDDEESLESLLFCHVLFIGFLGLSARESSLGEAARAFVF
jgi:hypothetical protein